MQPPRDMARRLAGLGRSARGYLAGLGTSGSLLAGAALMFILASALVAFHGWPHVATQPSPAEVVVSPQSAAASGSPVARRLTLISAARPRGAPRVIGRPVAGVRPGSGAVTPLTGTGRAIGRPVATAPPNSGAGGAPAGSGAASGACCGSAAPARPGPAPVRHPPVPTLPVPQVPVPPVPSPAPVQQVVGQTTGALGGVVSSAGNQVGSVVQQTTSAVGGAVAPVSPPVAGAVKSVGSGAAQTVTGVTNTIAGTLSGLGGN